MEPLLQVGEEHIKKQDTAESETDQSIVKKKSKRRTETDGNVPVL